MAILRLLVLVLAGSLVVAGCGRLGQSDIAAVDRQSADEIAERLGCTENLEEVDYFNAPIRGAAATRGLRCFTDTGDQLHIFERASLGDGRTDQPYAYAQGGSLENIDRLIGTGESRPGCVSWTLIGDSWFLLSDNQDTLLAAAEELNGEVRPVQPASPPASYLAPGCDSYG